MLTLFFRNAWQKLGNMSQEEAMEQYLALVSKEIPGLTKAGHTVSCLILRV